MQPPNQSNGRVARTRRCLGTLRPTPRGHSGGGLQTHTCPPRVLPGRLLPAVSGRLGPTAEADGVERGAAAAWRRLLSPVLPRKRPHSPQRTLASPQTAQDPRSHATLGPSDCDQLPPSWDRRSSHLRGPAPVPIGEEGSQRQTTHAGAQSTPFMAGAHGVCQHPVNTHGGATRGLRCRVDAGGPSGGPLCREAQALTRTRDRQAAGRGRGGQRMSFILSLQF